jgi:hypothetical protein
MTATMPSTLRTCALCGTEFYGRADAAYCSTGCRQKAYRTRTRNELAELRASSSETPSRDVTGGPVPDGEEWMAGRFAFYRTIGAITADVESRYKNPEVRERKIREAQQRNQVLLPRYVNEVAEIGQLDGYSNIDFDIPLGDTLPATVDPATAEELAEQLRAALPRVHELLALLERRARQAD